MALSPWVKPIAYCENDRYAQAVLLQRMSTREITRAPVWDDITTLLPEMLPRNGIDIIYGGFPCQDISVAGTRRGLEGKRSGLFYEIIRLATEIKPTFIFLENVPGIRTKGLKEVTGEITQLGYDCRWTILSASNVGAPHVRKRWWLLAHADRAKLWKQPRGKRWPSRENKIFTRNDGKEKPVASGIEKLYQNSWWDVESSVGRVANGIPHRSHRIRGLGNAVVPQCARQAFINLMSLGGIK